MAEEKTFYDEEIELLNSFQSMLKEEGFSPMLKETASSDKTPPQAALYLPVTADDPASPIIEMRVQKQVSPQEEAAIVACHFLVYFPEEVQADMVIDVALFLATINRHLPLPGFELDMGTHELYFRYVLYNAVASIDALTLKSLIGVIMYTVDSYLPALRMLATGQQRYHALMEEVAAAIRNQ